MGSSRSLHQLYDGIVPDLICMEASSKLECDELDETKSHESFALQYLNEGQMNLVRRNGTESAVKDHKLKDGFCLFKG